MDAEIQFFMTLKDETDFMVFAEKQVDEIIKDKVVYQLLIGDCKLQLIPSELIENTIYAGKLEIRLGNHEPNNKDLERAKASYRKLRNWIKKNYWSRLAYLDQNKNNRLTPSRVHWLAPDAKKWKESSPETHLLKLSKTSWMTFELGF